MKFCIVLGLHIRNGQNKVEPLPRADTAVTAIERPLSAYSLLQEDGLAVCTCKIITTWFIKPVQISVSPHLATTPDSDKVLSGVSNY